MLLSTVLTLKLMGRMVFWLKHCGTT